MTPNTLLKLGFATLAVGLFGCERQVSFTDDIQPILVESCIACHDQAAEGEAVSGLALRTYDDLMQGTQYGKVVVPGSSMSSALYLTVAGKTGPEIRMPPHHDESWAQGKGVPLTRGQIEAIQVWIDQGAKNN
jgi:hypothetical protein